MIEVIGGIEFKREFHLKKSVGNILTQSNGYIYKYIKWISSNNIFEYLIY